MTQWIKCSERMPEHDGDYLVWYKGNYQMQPGWCVEFYICGKGFEYPEEVNHWMPLPEPPINEATVDTTSCKPMDITVTWGPADDSNLITPTD